LGTMRELYSQLVNADSGWLSDDESVKSKKSDSVKSDDLCKFENMHTHLIEDNQTDMLGMLEIEKNYMLWIWMKNLKVVHLIKDL
jgi:hypothetical protein